MLTTFVYHVFQLHIHPSRLRHSACSVSEALGLESGQKYFIEDDQITVSSDYGSGYRGYYGRLNNDGQRRWACSDGDENDAWIQIDFRSKVVMQGFKIQGCGSGDNEYTKTVQIQYGDTEAFLGYITDGNQQKVPL